MRADFHAKWKLLFMYTTEYMEKLEKTPVVSMTGRLSLVSAGDVCVRKLQQDWPMFK